MFWSAGKNVLTRFDGIVRYWVNSYPELGEFSLPNVHSFAAIQPAPSIELSTTKEVYDMPRPAGKSKIASISVVTVEAAQVMAAELKTRGFEPQTVEFNGEGDIVSISCLKNDKPQSITPELYTALCSS